MIPLRKLVFAVCILGVLPFSGYAQVAPDKVKSAKLTESIEAVTGSKQAPSWNTILVPAESKDPIKKEFKLKRSIPDSIHVGVVENGESKTFIIPDIAPSKSEKFSYVLYVNSNKEIIDIDVLTYRESYGYEIDYPFFRKQFKGMDEAEEIRFNRSIQNISGATISARNITNAVHDLMLIVNRVGLE
ncbi:FMN-binding protein [Balneolaceae bacterium YR4-1]|uniref:FMN-binding protein n=1 Tax=Halalkalibaculum roseum TaxID=2709311 RepID=A0A6M1SK58_9BACT|nr:FMN-binding protein [Halalkalibaculum roseum]NGP75409.1 FMN-binding protein [Halalkalibaculum roseum]